LTEDPEPFRRFHHIRPDDLVGPTKKEHDPRRAAIVAVAFGAFAACALLVGLARLAAFLLHRLT